MRTSLLLCPDCGAADWALHVCQLPKRTDLNTLIARGEKRVASQREIELVMLVKAGCSLSEVGDAVGLSRERVRQLVGYHGVTGSEWAGWTRESLTDISKTLSAKLRLGKERAATIAMLRMGYRERLLGRVIQELYEDFGRSPTTGELSQAILGNANSGYLSGWVQGHSTKKESFAVVMQRAYKRAGVFQRNVGGAGHLTEEEKQAVG